MQDLVLEALSAIDEFMNPNRSTLNETQISANSDDCLSMDEVSADLDALQWRDFIDDEDNDNGSANMEKVYPRRGRRVKRRKVFDPVHLTKPRSKMAQRRRIFSEISLSACFLLRSFFWICMPGVCENVLMKTTCSSTFFLKIVKKVFGL